MGKMTVEDLDFEGQRVLMRVDFNVPIKGGQVADDNRIRQALPTIRYILGKKGKLILMSHLGRPKGEKKIEYSLKPCAIALADYLEQPVAFAPDCVGEETEKQQNVLKPETYCFLRTCDFTRRRKKTILILPADLRHWETFTSMMLLALPTAPMPPPRE
jgi:3-phosphoglycerate kinase